MLEKRNVVEPRRTPCRKDDSHVCDCPDCSKDKVKSAEAVDVKSLHDVEGLSRLHK